MAPKTLVVEDDPSIADVVSYQLSRAGHTVVVASDGVEALQAIRAHAPDLVLLDLMLPRVSGLDVLRVLRRDCSTPVIVISARAGEADKVNSLELGADDYITKPFSMRELMARVQAALRRSTMAIQEQPQSLTDIDLDVEQHEVRKHGERVQLTPREFELLAYLVRHANRVCSRDAILDAVWGYAYEGETRTVDVHVHWLRQKLEDDPAHPIHLLTVRHYGYKYVPDPKQGEQTNTGVQSANSNEDSEA